MLLLRSDPMPACGGIQSWGTLQVTMLTCLLAMALHVSVSAPSAPVGTVPYLKFSEVMASTPTDANVQYIVLRFVVPTAVGQPNVKGFSVVIYDRTSAMHVDNQVILAQDVANSGQGDAILMMTRQAERFFGITADVPLVGQGLPLAGRICIFNATSQAGQDTPDDCFVYGNAADDPRTRPAPQIANNAFNPDGGLAPGVIARRLRQSANSAADFVGVTTVWPANNAGAIGQPPGQMCGNGVVEGLEFCDDGPLNNTSHSACTATCRLYPGSVQALRRSPQIVCGNHQIESGETCDDGGTINLDGCSSSCQVEPLSLLAPGACGNGLLENAFMGLEECDDGNLVPDDGCDAQCHLSDDTLIKCGNGAVEPGEFCDSDTPIAQGCSSACTTQLPQRTSICGNGAVEPSESCDDGNLVDGDGCSKDCTIEMAAYFRCGDGIVSPMEACDGGSLNGQLGYRCGADCRLVQPPLATVQAPPTTPVSTSSGALSGTQQPNTTSTTSTTSNGKDHHRGCQHVSNDVGLLALSALTTLIVFYRRAPCLKKPPA